VDQYVARANINHYLSLLNSGAELSHQNSGTITKLLLAEEDKLGHDLEQLEFAETRAAAGVVPITIKFGNHLLLTLDVTFTLRDGLLRKRKMLQLHRSVHRLCSPRFFRPSSILLSRSHP
jgi:hypothetical protein